MRARRFAFPTSRASAPEDTAMAADGTGGTKYASEYPLPGGVGQYFDTLVALLRHIRDRAVTADGLAQWIFDTFPDVSGQIAVNGYISALSRLGVWSQQDNQIRLTLEGTAIVDRAESAPADARRLLLDIKYRDFAGYDVLFASLRQEPQDLDSLHEVLKQALAVDWKSKNQTSFRVNWLRSLDYVTKEGREYHLTDAGRALADQFAGDGKKAVPANLPAAPATPAAESPLLKRALEIADRLDRLATAGGDGKDFEQATETAFRFLGFDTQLVSGPGNPDVLATAVMGEKAYRVLVDAKSRASGVVQQNDVNLHALNKHKAKASADHVAVVAADFAGGNLAEFAAENQVRLLRVGELRDLLVAHAEAAFPLDVPRPLFAGGGATDEGVLSAILANAESRADAMSLARKLYAAVRQYQDQEGAIHADSLYFILRSEHSLPAIRMTVEFLRSDLIGALGETERGSLYTRLAPAALTSKLSQLTRTMDLSTSSPSG